MEEDSVGLPVPGESTELTGATKPSVIRGRATSGLVDAHGVTIRGGLIFRRRTPSQERVDAHGVSIRDGLVFYRRSRKP